MATLTVKNMPDELYEQLKTMAAANRRSINNEVIVIIERAIKSDAAPTDNILTDIRILREKLDLYVTDDEIKRTKGARRLNKAEIIKRAAQLRKLTAHYHLTNEELNKWKNEGRP